MSGSSLDANSRIVTDINAVSDTWAAPMRFIQVVETSTLVASTPSRNSKIDTIANLLRRTNRTEVEIAVAYLSGELRQRRSGVGWSAFRDDVQPATTPSLLLTEVDSSFQAMESSTGPGSGTLRKQMLQSLLEAATEHEQVFIRKLTSGNIRQGALAGVMSDAIARAWELPIDAVRRAAMLTGDLCTVARIATVDGIDSLLRLKLHVGTPLQPMLAQSASSPEQAIEGSGQASVEWKLDGVRIQAHKHGDEVEVYSRTLDAITGRVPEVIDCVRSLRVRDVILDGEAIALLPNGRPRPFQETGSRVASIRGDAPLRTSVPITPFFFDVLHIDGEDLIDRPLSDRLRALDRIVPGGNRIPRLVTDNPHEAEQFMRNAVEAGHEGIMVKSLGSPYEAGRRGVGWAKVKQRHTLDLVVLAVERGNGRRQGWLSNLHLGARGAVHGEFVMLGKTFKGLSDAMLRWQTDRLQLLTVRDDGYTVFVRPELVVEVAFDGVQTSSRYPGGMALRFARVVRYREDKSAREADTIDAVREVYLGSHG
jgi:DNA ligase-1